MITFENYSFNGRKICAILPMWCSGSDGGSAEYSFIVVTEGGNVKVSFSLDKTREEVDYPVSAANDRATRAQHMVDQFKQQWISS